MEPEGIVYDDEGDIFYNDKYLEILKVKDYVLDIDGANMGGEYLDKPVFKKNHDKKKLETNVEKYDYVNNRVKNRLIQFFNRNIVINKYLAFKDTKPRTTCINYIIKKFTKKRLINKNIYFLYFITKFIKPARNIVDGTLMEKTVQSIYKYGKNNNIYNWIIHSGKKKYARKVYNKKNNTNYELLNYDTSGDIMRDNNMKLFIDRNKNIKFDFLYISLHPYYKEFGTSFENNYLMIILYFIIQNAKKGCQIIFNGQITKNIVHNFISIMSKYFKHTKIIHPKYLHITTYDQYILFDDFDGQFNSNDTATIKNIIFNKQITNMNLYLHSFAKSNMVFVVNIFLEKLAKDKIKVMQKYMQLIPYLYNTKYDKLREIIMYNIKKKQISYANKPSNIKYLKY